jgi:hypothetical protein
MYMSVYFILRHFNGLFTQINSIFLTCNGSHNFSLPWCLGLVGLKSPFHFFHLSVFSLKTHLVQTVATSGTELVHELKPSHLHNPNWEKGGDAWALEVEGLTSDLVPRVLSSYVVLILNCRSATR